MTMQGFLQKHRIEMTAELVESNPNIADMPAGSRHWRCVFGPELHAFYSQGPAIEREPEAADVLACIANDAASVDCNDFETWAAEFGYDSDSRRAERIFNACREERRNLKRFLGRAGFESALLQAAAE